MPINYPQSQDEVFNRILADVQNQIPDAGPFLRNSFIYALCVALAGRWYDNYQLLKQLEKQMFPDTSTGDFLVRWGGYVDENPLESTPSTGNVVMTGTDGVEVPLETTLQTSTGLLYESTEVVTIADNTISIASITRTGDTATVTTTSDHSLASNIEVVIAGANQSDYNGTFTILVTDVDTFTYTVENSPATPATGTITAAYTGALVPIQSLENGVDMNLDAGTLLTLTSPVAGIDTNAYVDFGEVGNGTDDEADSRYRERVIYKYQNPVNLFNEAAITAKARQVSGVTRVFPQAATPTAGSTTVYFTRDDDESGIIPSSSEVAAVKAALLTIKPWFMDDDDVIVAAPTAVPVDFTFTELTPNTTTMQEAIQENLEQLFTEDTEVGVNLLRAAYESAIYQTVDLETGDVVESFTLTDPSGTVTIATGEIATLGTISYS